MKKILLSLFLLLGVLSFAAPSYVDVNRIENDGYKIAVNNNDTLHFAKGTSSGNIIVATLFFVDDGNTDILKQAFKTGIARELNLKYTGEVDTKKAYVQKSTSNEEKYSHGYNVIAKKQKVKGCYVTVLILTKKELPDEVLDTVADAALMDIEGYLK